MRNLKITLKTFGCQMNEYDSELASGLLVKEGYELAHDEAEADAVIFNTCSVREHAEERVWGQLGELAHAKRNGRAGLVLGLMGCMAEVYRERLFKRFPELDFVIGTRNVKDVVRVVTQVLRDRTKLMALDEEGLGIEYSEFTRHSSSVHAWVPIMTGCNKVCTFCIVPKTRGPEISKPADEVIEEAKRLAERGFKAVTLLGQNVNSYGKDLREGLTFPRLLEELARIDGLEMISFTTSHPSDAGPELFEAICANPKISRRFHLPLQSGSDQVLRRMKRLHTLAKYRKKIDLMRQQIPEVSVTTDIIVGFPGETLEEYEATRRALEEIQFDSAFIYKYSTRPGTPAAALADDVPLPEKKRRNAELLDLQDRITEAKNRALIGSRHRIMIEKENLRRSGEVVGRTWADKKVILAGEKTEAGLICEVLLKALINETFVGERS